MATRVYFALRFLASARPCALSWCSATTPQAPVSGSLCLRSGLSCGEFSLKRRFARNPFSGFLGCPLDGFPRSAGLLGRFAFSDARLSGGDHRSPGRPIELMNCAGRSEHAKRNSKRERSATGGSN